MNKSHVYLDTISEIKEHTNADKLELAIIGGWQCVIPKNKFKVGESIVYIPVNSVLPVGLSEYLGVTTFLHNQRVKAVKLRGEKSYGIVVSCSVISSYGVNPKSANLASDLKIEKYEIPEKAAPAQALKKMSLKEMYFYVFSKTGGRDIRFRRLMSKLFKNNKIFGWLFRDYTNNENFKAYDIDNFRRYNDIIKDGEKVWITEKIHGTNFRAGWVNNKWYVGSHHVVKPEDESCAYWQYSKIYDLKSIVKTIWKENFPNAKSVVIYGEVFGPKIQKLEYGVKKPNIAFFDLLVDGKWVDAENFINIMFSVSLPTVPTIYEGEWSSEMIDFANGMSLLNRKHIREGFVVKPLVERHDPRLGRVILKYVSDAYLLGDYDDGSH